MIFCLSFDSQQSPNYTINTFFSMCIRSRLWRNVLCFQYDTKKLIFSSLNLLFVFYSYQTHWWSPLTTLRCLPLLTKLVEAYIFSHKSPCLWSIFVIHRPKNTMIHITHLITVFKENKISPVGSNDKTT